MQEIENIHRACALAAAALAATALAGVARAEAPRAPDAPVASEADQLTGFTARGSGELSGVVTTLDGKPAAGATVYIVAAAGPQQQVVTDAQGRYRVVIPGGRAYTMVFVQGPLRIGGQLSVLTRVPEGEGIEIHETIAPAVMPRPLTSTALVPAYSDAAKDRGAWARAWLMLDVDERGAVARVKLLGRPGQGLDGIAVRDAFALRFEPARDRADRPTNALVLWSYEWPSYWWMSERRLPLGRLPAEVAQVPCKGSGGTQRYYRDCARPDLARGLTEPWIERPRK